MTKKPTYKELEQRVYELEEKVRSLRTSYRDIGDFETIKQLLNFSPHAMYLIDLSGKIVAVNQAGAEHLGKTVEAMTGTLLRDYFPDDVSEKRVNKGLEAIQLKQPVSFEDRIEERWYRSTIIPIFDKEQSLTHLAIYGVDITLYHNALEALHKTESMYRLHFENVTDVISLIDSELKFLNVSPSVEKVLGYKPEELIGRPLQKLNLLPPEYLKKATADIRRVFGGETIPSVEYQFITKDGTIKWGDVSGAPLIKEGRIVAHISVARDITERKQAEEALKESEQEKSAILDSLVEHVIHEDKDMKIQWANQAACESAGMPLKELINRHCYEIWPHRSDPCPDCPVMKAIKTGTPHEIEKATPDGRNWFIRGYPLRDARGEIVGGTELTLEITERRRLEEKLKKSEERYRTIIDGIEEAYFEVDLTGTLTFFNDALCKITGYSHEELTGMNNREYTTQETAQKMYKTFNKVYQTGKPLRVDDYEIIVKDGRKMVIELSTSLIRDPDGTPIGFRGIFRDSTERKRSEEELKTRQTYLESVLYSAPDAIVTLDATHRIIDWNIGAEQIFGYSRHDVVGKNLDDLVTGPDVIEESRELTT